MKKAKVLFVIDHLGIGGVQEFILNYCKKMVMHKVTVLSLFTDDVYSKRINDAGGKVIFLSKLKYNYKNIIISNVYVLYKNFIFNNIYSYDIIYIKLFASFLYSSLLGMYRFLHVTAGVDCGLKQIPKYLLLLYKFYAQKYNIFFVPTASKSEYNMLSLKQNSLLDFPYFLTKRYSNCRKKHNDESIQILTIGRCIKQKGFIDVIEFIIKLQKYTNRKLTLILIGDGPYLENVKRYIDSKNLKNIYCLGSVLDLDDYIFCSDLIIKMSYCEGPNSVVREALLAGKLVASTLETPFCRALDKEGMIIGIDRNDLENSAKMLARIIGRNFADYDTSYISEITQRLWGDEKIINYYEKIAAKIKVERQR